MFHVYLIKISFHIVLGVPPPVLDISGNIFFRFNDSPRLNTVKSVNINLLEVPSFSAGEGMGSLPTTT